MTYEISIVGGSSAYVIQTLGRHRPAGFQTFEAAKAAAQKLLQKFDADGTRGAHPAIIYGPDCGHDGTTVT